MKRLFIAAVVLSGCVNQPDTHTAGHRLGDPACLYEGRECPIVDASHYCKYLHCPFKGQTVFVSGCGECEQGTDCWALDSIHFYNPALNYEGNELVLFGPPETGKAHIVELNIEDGRINFVVEIGGDDFAWDAVTPEQFKEITGWDIEELTK